jgi:O-antigen/teichoic acid export membrane protein
MQQIGQSQVLRGLSSTTVALASLLAWERLDLALALGVLANVAVVTGIDGRRVRRLTSEASQLNSSAALSAPWPSIRWGRIVKLALPLALSTLFVSLSINMPRLFLSRLASEGTLGVFTVLCYCCFPATMLVSAILQAATPRLARLYRDDPVERYTSLLRRLMLAVGVIAVANWWLIHFLGHTLLETALGAQYATAAGQLDWIAAASGIGFIAAVPATAMNAQRCFRVSLVTCILSCTVAAVAGAKLIPQWVMTGAAVTMMLTSAVHLLLSLLALRLASPSDAISKRSEGQVRPLRQAA